MILQNLSKFKNFPVSALVKNSLEHLKLKNTNETFATYIMLLFF